MIARHDGEPSHAGGEIGRLLDACGERGLDGSTPAILTANRGEGHGEHQGCFARNLYAPCLRVPRVTRFPAGPVRPGRIESQARVAKTEPDVLDWPGVPVESRSTAAALNRCRRPPTTPGLRRLDPETMPHPRAPGCVR